MSASQKIANFVLLPELILEKSYYLKGGHKILHCSKKKMQEYCPYCASGDHWTHEYRIITVKDAPIRGKVVILKIKKRRLRCKSCNKTFNEPIPGIMPRGRYTQRFKRSLNWACQNFRDLKKVRKAFRCSTDTVYKAHYQQLELNRRRKLNYPWPKTLGIDEHAFRRASRGKSTTFATMIVDFSNKRPMELVEGKTGSELWGALGEIPGRENVTTVALDLCDPYKKFVKEFFPNANLVADKLHVLRLLNHHIMRRRKEITGDRASWRARSLLLTSNKKLDYFQRKVLWEYLDKFPELKEVYAFKESLYAFYRIKGYNRATKALTKLTDRMANSKLKEIKTLRKTLMKWRQEILNYFKTGITNARTEGFNNIAKLLQRNAFGFKSFENYRLKVLNASI
jgi:transposase